MSKAQENGTAVSNVKTDRIIQESVALNVLSVCTNSFQQNHILMEYVFIIGKPSIKKKALL